MKCILANNSSIWLSLEVLIVRLTNFIIEATVLWPILVYKFEVDSDHVLFELYAYSSLYCPTSRQKGQAEQSFSPSTLEM